MYSTILLRVWSVGLDWTHEPFKLIKIVQISELFSKGLNPKEPNEPSGIVGQRAGPARQAVSFGLGPFGSRAWPSAQAWPYGLKSVPYQFAKHG